MSKKGRRSEKPGRRAAPAIGKKASEAAQARDQLLYDAVLDFQSARYVEAEAKSSHLLAVEPLFPAALLLHGMIASRTGRATQAIDLLRRAAALDSRNADVRNELASALRAEGRTDEAIMEASHAVRLQPDDPGSHNNLGLCFLASWQSPRAVDHFKRAISLGSEGFIFHHNLALALHQQSRDVEAMAAFRRAIELNPLHADSLAHLGQMLFSNGRPQEAVACYERAVAAESDPTRRALHRAAALMQQGLATEAEAALRGATVADSTADLAHHALGELLQRRGKFDEAHASFTRALELQPKRGAAYLSLVTGRKIEASDRALIHRMRAMLDDAGLAPFEQRHLHYALGKAFDDLGDYASAILHYDRANQIMATLLRRAGQSFDRDGFEAGISRSIENSGPAFFASRPATAANSDLPVLIVGMPRSGTTLVEQILSSHREIGAAGELSYWTDRSRAMTQSSLERLAEAERSRLADDYIAVLRMAAPAARRVTDKMPTNFMVLGLIHHALPGARIIHCRRNPLDTCLSIYFTPTGNPLNFTHDRSDIVFYYEQYVRLMAHWRSVLPSERFLEIDYEMLVAEPERVARRMLEFCRLPWDDACLSHEGNAHMIATPSLWQARQPIYGRAVERWRRYRDWLGDLRRLLPAADR